MKIAESSIKPISYSTNMKDILRKKLGNTPPRATLLTVFSEIAFFIYGWNVLWSLWRIPSWLHYLKVVEVINAFSYILVESFLESCALLLLFFVLSLVFPSKYYRDLFVPQSTALSIVILFWAITIQFSYQLMYAWTLQERILWLLSFLFNLIIIGVIVFRFRRVQKALSSFAERTTLFLYLYLPLTVISFVIVVIRNVF